MISFEFIPMWPKKKGLSKVNNTENNAIFLLNRNQIIKEIVDIYENE